jgi:TonB family protein
VKDAGAAQPVGDERQQLPSDRPERRDRDLRRALLLSLVFHVLFALLLVFLVRVVAPVTVASDEESQRVTWLVPSTIYTDQRAKIREKESPQTNVAGIDDARARSPGEGAPTPHGETSFPEPDAGKRRGRPEARPRKEPQITRKLEEPAKQPPSSKVPTEIAPLRNSEDRGEGESLEARQQRLLDALHGIGGTSDLGELDGTPSSGLGTSWGGGEMQIESRSDLDWGPWAAKAKEKVRRNWISIIPVAARVGMKGIVLVRFRVQRDGTITDFEMLESSGVPPLDQAADDALVRMSSPLPPLPLPESSDEESIRVTYMFIYNLDDDREVRQWRRLHWRPQAPRPG